MIGVLIRTDIDTQRHVKAEAAVMCPQARKHHGPMAASRSCKGDMEQILPSHPQKEHGPTVPDPALLASRLRD